MKKIINWFGVLLVSSFFTGCYLLFYRSPSSEKFSFYNKKSADVSWIKTNGLYYYNEEKGVHISQYVIQFTPSIVYFQTYGGNDTLLDYAIEDMQKDINDKKDMNDKGYYFIDNDTVKMEILRGDPAHGYYFIYYKGIKVGNGLLISQTGHKPYKHPMKDYELGNKSSALLTPRLFRFKPL